MSNDRKKEEGTVKYYNVSETSKLLGVSAQSLRNWDDDGSFPCHHKSAKGNYRKYTMEQIQDFLRNRGTLQKNKIVVGYYVKDDSEGAEYKKELLSSYIGVLSNNVTVDLTGNSILSDEGTSNSINSSNMSKIIDGIIGGVIKELVVVGTDDISELNMKMLSKIAELNRCKITVLSVKQ